MFLCTSCKKVIGPAISPQRVVLETRDKEYEFRKDAFKVRKEGAWVRVSDQGGHGHETVKEVDMCTDCAFRFHTGNEPVLTVEDVA